MSEIKILKPALKGSIVRDPDNMEPLPEEGKAVRMTTYWSRRLNAEEVVEIGATKKLKGGESAETAGKE